MLKKDPIERPSAKECLQHEWVIKYMSPQEKESLNLEVQENMKRFQEE